MTGVSERLDAIEARKNAATPGPWVIETSREPFEAEKYSLLDIERWRGYHNSVQLGEDKATAEFIAHAPQDITELLDLARKQQAAIDAVKGLHVFAHTDVEPWAKGYRFTGDHCAYDGEHWPCTTAAAITGEGGA